MKQTLITKVEKQTHIIEVIKVEKINSHNQRMKNTLLKHKEIDNKNMTST